MAVKVSSLPMTIAQSHPNTAFVKFTLAIPDQSNHEECYGYVQAREARGHILHGPRPYKKLGEKMHQTSFMIGVAGLVLQEGEPQRAAQFLGVVESELEALNIVMDFEIQSFHIQTLRAVRKQFGESAFQSAWGAGGKRSLEEAMNFAFGDHGIGNRN